MKKREKLAVLSLGVLVGFFVFKPIWRLGILAMIGLASFLGALGGMFLMMWLG